MIFADVIVPLPLQDTYTYLVPDHLADAVAPGVRVMVPFGKKQQVVGLIAALQSNQPKQSPASTATSALSDQPVFREITSVISDRPVVREKHLELWRWIARYYICSLGEVMKAALPAWDYSPKTLAFVSLHPSIDSPEKWEEAFKGVKRAVRQQELMEHTKAVFSLFTPFQKKLVSKKELLDISGASEAVLQQLVSKRILQISYEEVSRLDQPADKQASLMLLSEEQELVLASIREQFKVKPVVLLYGVTASGKTEIYLHLAEEAVRAGKQVLYLVPEISLTPQIETRLRDLFGTKVATYHSKMSDAERAEVWERVLSFEEDPAHSIQVVLGARSALMLPFVKPGLIIADEEHETSYKQSEPAPRYHARDMAVVMGHLQKIPVLLGSATPSFESYSNAKHGKYGYAELKKRYANAWMPEIVVADMQRAWKRKKMLSILTPELYHGMVDALKEGEQVILFQNRRGFSSFLECMNCGKVPYCKHCDVSLTYHKHANRLICHYCGYTEKIPAVCPACGSDEIKTRGLGTEKAEEEIALLFPDARITRMDTDSTRSKNAFNKIFNLLEKRKTDILIGTQMVTKGLDFEHIRVVGVLNADNMLNFPDFRAFERAFQLMSQVSGRSGRKDKQGTVYIQTSQPDHPVIKYVKNHDFEGLFAELMPERKAFNYPPWSRLIKIIVKDREESKAAKVAGQLADILRKSAIFRVMGPQAPLVGRVNLWYIREVWLKVGRDQKLADVQQTIRDAIATVRLQPGNHGTAIHPDVDAQ